MPVLLVGRLWLKVGLFGWEGLELLNSMAKLKSTAFCISYCSGKCKFIATTSYVLALLRDYM